MKRFLSFGAGVQSTALWLLIGTDRDRLESLLGGVPERAFFADTGAEPIEIYQHIERLQAIAQMDDRFLPIEIVQKPGPSLESVMLSKQGSRFTPIPAFTRNGDGQVGMLRRQCTREYKIAPLLSAYRSALGYKPRQRIPPDSAESWIGISVDEAGRAKRSEDKWISKRYPLLEMNLTRTSCAEIIKLHGLPPVKSRCVFCPYISDWFAFRHAHPEGFRRAVAVDDAIRDSTRAGAAMPAYVHRSCTPLSQLNSITQLSLFEAWEDQWFEEECEGICGL